MDTTGLTLLIPDKSDVERDAVAIAWENQGGTVLRLGRFWDPPALDPARARVYGNDSFCLVLEQKLGLQLCSPPDDLLTTLSTRFLGRSVTQVTVSAVESVTLPAFVKSLIPKQIASQVYQTHDELAAACAGLDSTTGLLISEPVELVAEARCFVLSKTVLDCAFYEGSAAHAAAISFASAVATDAALPRAVVVDIGMLRDGRWVVIEFNAAWGAGLNGCDPRRVLPAIAAAPMPSDPLPHAAG